MVVCATSAFLSCVPSEVHAQFSVGIDIEQAPFEYSKTAGSNRVTKLIEKLESKEVELEYSRDWGYLRSLLEALEIPESSQTLVFSKTSMQVRYISKRNPRAIYFNDDTYVGWVHGSSLMEISTADPKLGAAFYTVDMKPWRARIERENYDCLGCHATSMTQGVPGHTVRSVYPAFDGSVNAQRDSFISDDTSPFPKRWGGWFVTGLHGEMRHMGNAFLRGDQLDTSDNGNRLHLRDDFDTSNYLSPYSDIVALMVLEHQTQMHNTIARADFFVRHLLHETADIEATEASADEDRIQLQMIAKDVVKRLLFVGETMLTSKVKGSVVFKEEFSSQGPTDAAGRSFRDFNLETRLFEYPCSYLIYSQAFDELTPSLKGEVFRQLHEVLTGKDDSEEYKHLTADTRADIHAILMETKPGFPL